MGNYLVDVITDALARGYAITIESRKGLFPWDCRVVVSNGDYCVARDIMRGYERLLTEGHFKRLIDDMIAEIERAVEVKRRASQC